MRKPYVNHLLVVPLIVALIGCGNPEAATNRAPPISPPNETVRQESLPYENEDDVAKLWSLVKVFRRDRDWKSVELILARIWELDPHHIEAIELHSRAVDYASAPKGASKRRKYEGLRRSISVLVNGVEKNPRNVALLASLKIRVGKHIGDSGLRNEFEQDLQLHSRLGVVVDIDDARRLDHRVDNWLVAGLIAKRAVKLVESGERRRNGKLTTYTGPAISTAYFAIARAQNGGFDESTTAWNTAAHQFRVLAERRLYLDRIDVDQLALMAKMIRVELPRSVKGADIEIRLADSDAGIVEAASLWKQFDAKYPELRQMISRQKRAKLPVTHRLALDTPPRERAKQQHVWAIEAENRIRVTTSDVPENFKDSLDAESLRILNQIAPIEQRVLRAQFCRKIVNFDCWITRCRVELLPQMQNARRQLFKARRLLNEQSDASGRARTRELFESAFQTIRDMLDEYPILSDGKFSKELQEDVRLYRDQVLRSNLPKGFPLGRFVQPE